MRLFLLVSGFAAVSAQLAVNGGWSDWTDNGLCCGGFIQRVRACNNPAPSGGGAACAGPSELSFTCEVSNCETENGGWSEWTESPCCNGAISRTRTCLSVFPEFCPGEAMESVLCEREDGSTDCFIANTQTGSCEIPVSQESQTLYETREECCSTQFPQSFEACMGTEAPTAPTPSDGSGNEEDGVVDGGWSEWTEFNTCCDNTQSRFRVCNNPAPSANGAPCEGSFREERPCTPNVCNVEEETGTDSSNAHRLAVLSVTTVIVALTSACF